MLLPIYWLKEESYWEDQELYTNMSMPLKAGTFVLCARPCLYNPFWQMIRYDEENILLNSRWHGIYSFNMKTYEVKKIESFTENNYTSIFWTPTSVCG